MSGIQMVVRYWDHHSNTGQNLVRYSNSIRWSDNFRPFEYQTSPVFRSPLYIYMFAIDVQPFVLSQKHLASNKLYIKTWKRCCYCEFFVVHWINIHRYSRHSDTGLVWFSNGPNLSGSQMVRFSNGLGPQTPKCHSKTGQFRPVFKWFGSTETKMPFKNRTLKCPVFGWIWYSGVRFSDGYCTSNSNLFVKPSTNPCHSLFAFYRWILRY